MFYNISIPVSILFFNTLLAIYIFLNNRKNIVNKLFALQIFSASFWVFSNFMADISEDPSALLYWTRIALIGASLVVLLGYFFSLYFPREKSTKKIYKYIILLFGLLIIILSPTSWNVESVSRTNGGFVVNTGFLYIPFIFYFFLTTILSVFNFLSHAETILEKAQVKFVVIGISISSAGAIFTNAILPVLGNSQYVSFGPYFVIFFIIFTFYAIAKHHLFNIKIIATEFFALILWVILLTKIFSSNSIQDLSMNISIFAAVVIVGVLLVRSVIKEVEQKEKIEQMARELAKAYEVEKKANEELKKLDEVKNQFLMQVQHDLRTPLSTIRDYCDVLIDGTIGKQSNKTIKIVRRIEAIALAKIQDINNFLDVAQFRLGRGVVNLKPGVNIVEIIKEIQNSLKLKYEQKGLYFKIEKIGEQFIVTADREKLKAAIFNIVDNSIKYTEKGGVTIRLKVNNSKLKIEIADTGIGIPADKVKNIFEGQFERTEQAQKVAEGKGVGLYLSAQIIKLHNGRVWVESAGEGMGATFFIELPVELIKK